MYTEIFLTSNITASAVLMQSSSTSWVGNKCSQNRQRSIIAQKASTVDTRLLVESQIC